MGDRDCLHCSIGAVQTEFAHALDHRDVEPFVALFTDDAAYDNGRTVVRGHDELRRWMSGRATGPVRTTRHVWSALRLGAPDGDELAATSTWVCYAANTTPPIDAVTVWSVADFHDRFRLVDGAWKIATRRIDVVFRDPTVAPPT